MSNPHRFKQNLNWNLLKQFDEIVAAGGISRAAQNSARKQPALSLALQRLEDHLGAKLCNRGPTGFSLTPEGESVAEFCARIASLVALLPDRIAESSTMLKGQVRVHVVSALHSPELDGALKRFRTRFPLVELAVSIGPWEEIAAHLLRSEIDIGIGPISFRHQGLAYDLLFNEFQQIYCATDHPLAGHVVRDLALLAREAFVLKHPGEPEEIMRYRLRHGLGQMVAARADHIDEVRRLIRLGSGIGFLPAAAAADDVGHGRLWPLTPNSRKPFIPIYIVTNPSAPPYLVRDMLLSELRSADRPHHTRSPREPTAEDSFG